jgi:Protein of unknown function (DUF2793)
MARTAQLDLPLVMPAQAQKHVTVNEALARLDATAQLRVVSSVLAAPPGSATDGVSYLIPGGATGEWSERAGQIAVWSNGGWVYLAPRAGWRAWDESRFGPQTYDGTGWVADAVAVSARGAGTIWKVVEFDHAVAPGGANDTVVAIPNQTQVLGVTGRVVSVLSGPGLTGWKIGVSGSADRYGSGLGLAEGSYLLGMSGTPVTYYGDTPLVLTAEGGQFAAGSIRLAVHLVQLVPPRAA